MKESMTFYVWKVNHEDGTKYIVVRATSIVQAKALVQKLYKIEDMELYLTYADDGEEFAMLLE